MEDKINPASEEFVKQMRRVGTKEFERVFEIDGESYYLDAKLVRLKERCKLCGKPRWEDE